MNIKIIIFSILLFLKYNKMKNNFFKVKIRDKETNYKKILELLKLSAENNIIHLNYYK
jgi:hypothetical protein